MLIGPCLTCEQVRFVGILSIGATRTLAFFTAIESYYQKVKCEINPEKAQKEAQQHQPLLAALLKVRNAFNSTDGARWNVWLWVCLNL